MNITITGRHFEVSEDLYQYAEKKLTKLEKYFHKLIDMEVVMYMEKHNHVTEVVVSGDGTKFYGKEKAGDMYSAIDLLNKSMEKQALKHKEKHSGHKVLVPTKNTPSAEPAQDETAEVLFSQAADRPMDEVEAFLEMRLDNKNFILFNRCAKYKDENDIHDNYAVIYKLENGFRMAEIPLRMIKEKRFDEDNLHEFDLVVNDDSSINPKIKLKKCSEKTIKGMAMSNAIKEIMTAGRNFLPFFNNETNFFNIIYKNGNSIEAVVPPSQNK